MTELPPTNDDGCLICGRSSDAVPVGVVTEYRGDGPREGERAWICEACAQVEAYARAFVYQAREQFSYHGGVGYLGIENGPSSHGFGYRIVSPVLRGITDEHGFNRFHEWTMDI